MSKMRIGDYPPEYNRAIHGPYDPARYYGKRKYNEIFIQKIEIHNPFQFVAKYFFIIFFKLILHSAK